MAPSNGTTSTPPKCPLPQSWSSPSPATIAHYSPPPNHSTLQWHPTMAPSNGTTSTPLKLVVTLPPNHSTLQWQPTMAPAWCHVQSAKVVRRPPPFLEVRTPIAIAIWGKIKSVRADFFAEIKVERLHNTSGNNVKPLYFLLFFFPGWRFVPFPPIRAVLTNQGTLLGKEVALVSKCYSLFRLAKRKK